MGERRIAKRIEKKKLPNDGWGSLLHGIRYIMYMKKKKKNKNDMNLNYI